MRPHLLVLVLLTFLALAAGCYRTHYANFSDANPHRGTSYAPIEATGWQSFFLYGWAPGEKRIDAVEECGSTEEIASIRTRRTFLEGLVAAFAGYYINIYSPWDGAVYCTEAPQLDETAGLARDPGEERRRGAPQAASLRSEPPRAPAGP